MKKKSEKTLQGLYNVGFIGVRITGRSEPHCVSTLGFVIIGVFIFSWIGSMIVYRIKGFDRLESTTPIAD
jgi:hypothetical protein